MNGTCPGKSHGSSIRLRSGELRGGVDTLSSRQVARAVPEQFLWCCSSHVPAGEATAMRECCCLEGVYVVCNCVWVCEMVKWHPHECQDPWFSSRTLHL